MRHALALCVLSFSAASVSSEKILDQVGGGTVTEVMLFTDDPSKWSKPKAILPPQYPSEMRERGIAGIVDVEVSIDERGSVLSASVAKPEAENRLFEDAVMEVVKQWRFEVRHNKECVPEKSNGNVRVWFEPDGANGKISVSGAASIAAAQSETAPKRARMVNRAEAFAQIRYPEAARRAGVEANLNVVAKVNAAQGVVKDVLFSSREYFGSADSLIRSRFELAITSAVMRWKFLPQEGPDYRVCIPFVFQFR
ncbi:MAG: TonB family protein [Betaproteobacteria bacterium]|nr:TonB family protein [Betaproteobacteria bacterium]